MSNYLKKLLYSMGLIFVIFLTVANTILWVFESSFIFKPSVLVQWDLQEKKPAEVWLHSKDGTRLNAGYIQHENPQARILYLHGNTGNIASRYAEIMMLHDRLSASIMILDYRGFGQSEGHPEEKGMSEDAEAAQNWFAEKEKVEPEEILLVGRSLGTGVAVSVAVHQGAKGLVLISPFLSLPDTVRYHYPFLFPQFIMHNHFDSLHKISAYHGPLLIIHGDADELIPIQHGRALFAAAHEPKIFVEIEGGRHADPLSEVVYQAIKNFNETIK